MLIPAHHEVFGDVLVPESRVRLHPDEFHVFDPAGCTVPEVLAHLAAAGPSERNRVLDLERAAATPRVTVLDAYPQDTPTPDAVGAGPTPTPED